MKLQKTETGFTTDLGFGTLTIAPTDADGFRPYQLLVASIAACSGGSLAHVLQKMRMPVTDLQVEVTNVIRNEEEANRIEEVHLHFYLTGDFKEDKLARAMDLAEKNCAMVQSVNENITIHKSVTIN